MLNSIKKNPIKNIILTNKINKMSSKPEIQYNKVLGKKILTLILTIVNLVKDRLMLISRKKKRISL